MATTENVNNAVQKVFHRDIIEISQLSNNREEIMDKLKQTVVQSATVFSDTRWERSKMAEGMCKSKSSMGGLFRSYSRSSYKRNRGIWQQIAAVKGELFYEFNVV